ncbi:MAG: TetR/AcrR family transcriptional regulator [Acidobacteriota bacterium]|nr:TetR/AcrR family transcriptional regulator [Acidobacteriota bacterium]
METPVVLPDIVRRPRDRKAREASLLSAAGKLFASRGYEATTTREIASRAGCAEGLISRYFKGKAGLLNALIRAHTSKRQTAATYSMPKARDFEHEITQLIASEIEQIWQDREFYKAIIPTALRDGVAGPNLSQITLAMESASVVRRLKQSRHSRDLTNEQRSSLAQLINVNAFIFGFWYPIALGQNLSLAKQSAVTMASLIAERFQDGRLSLNSPPAKVNIIEPNPHAPA